MKNERHQKFCEISERRMTRVFENMNLIANLSNKKNYEFVNEEIEELFYSYRKKGEEIKSYFENNVSIKPTVTEFKFLGKSNIEILEPKRKKFRELAESRMTKVFQDMNLIANLSNKTNYTYTIQEVDELFQAYEEKGRMVESRFLPLIKEFKYTI
ncbi:hypothetical protein P9B03_11190 [Metasolibacillus meyeri]|uniref:Uncharacterized protein n=1 Tax=Metasolibacillus meyeri TaxID=1071052 RepID=A0AAW9NX65_9BACL|nr:hypothetical protein [Metasolibacillus meyeri]MEC1179048.1 hypothetical protein [Metasolibacillus meyeri]